MAAASTNGKGKDEDRPSGTPVSSTHESVPGDSEKPDPGLDVLSRGSTVGRYLVLEGLGAGAMGVVYAAYDPELDRKVAIKLLRPARGGDQERRRARLVREAKAIAKVSHPNVVSIFDVGVHEGQVFLAMEYLAGGTLRDWLAKEKRDRRDVVKTFIEVGNGLAAAHAEGLIHRDFKPDNVLLDKSGKPKVVDFGLVVLTTAIDLLESTGAPDPEATSENEPPAAEPPAKGRDALTRTGALTGTPAYMAPEQFLGKAVDARTDQFAFCVALYEALYGERPFAGENLIALADSVTENRIKPIPKDSDIPAWIRRCLVHGLRADPAQRYSSFDELLSTLSNDPVARLRRRIVIGLTSAALLAGAIGVRQAIVSKRQEIEKQVGEHVGIADTELTAADGKRTQSRSLRARAFAEFDNFQRDKGEELWAQSLSAAKAADDGYLRGIQHLEAAVALAPRSDLKRRIADAMVDYIGMDGRTSSERDDELRQLARYDEGGAYRQRLSAPANLRVKTTPVNLVARLETYDPVTHQVLGPEKPLGRTPLDVTLAPGLYRVTFEGTATHAGFRFPILVSAGEKRDAEIRVPARAAVPEGFIYVPEGQFLFGSQVEDLRTGFFDTVPLHAIETRPFLISKYETTIGEWIGYLSSLPSVDRERRRPQGKRDGQGGEGGFVELHQTPEGKWEYLFRATTRMYKAEEGRPFRYDDRDALVSQNWLKFPVTGVSPEAALDYAAWLDRSGRVPGARLCDEREWERAARGADGRDFPSGRPPRRTEANFDLTYGRKSGAYGPDEVGRHSASASPFDVEDVLGNVWEITSSSLDAGQFVSRGGSFYQNLRSCVSPNREPIASVTRDHTIGVRICANARL